MLNVKRIICLACEVLCNISLLFFHLLAELECIWNWIGNVCWEKAGCRTVVKLQWNPIKLGDSVVPGADVALTSIFVHFCIYTFAFCVGLLLLFFWDQIWWFSSASWSDCLWFWLTYQTWIKWGHFLNYKGNYKGNS